jgi:hypothetical protein
MKVLKIHIIIWIAGIFFMACTSRFEDYNTDPVGVSGTELEQDFNHIGVYFPVIQQMIYCNYDWGQGTEWTFQRMQNLNADIWSGYMASASTFGFGGIDNQTYFLRAGWNDAAWDFTYSRLMPNTLKITEECKKNYPFYAHFDAVNKILKVLAMSRLCDQYGPVIYTHYGESKTGGIYDAAQEAYKAFFNDLHSAVDTLNNYVLKNSSQKPFTKFDMVYSGDYTKWIKTANTLRLRLAMRIVKYDAGWAQAEAEAAVIAPGGLILLNNENFTLSGKRYTHPLAIISGKWKDISLSANMESILSGYGDPRLEQIALPAADGKIRGMRTGIPNLDSNDYSVIASSLNILATDPVVLMTAAETHFLLAEGVLRGWKMNGNAKSLYEKGIELSFAQWSVSIGNYLSCTKTPSDFIDPLQPELLTSPAASTVSPNWNSAANDEERLEKIITQKWIACFPEGCNAWAEKRRTGYPKLFPIAKNDSQGSIPTELGVRRLPFSSMEKSGNPEGVADAISKLDGPDAGFTRLFWDVDKENF